ncbi:MAG: hypothetical protein JOZ86_09350 [Candidatus Eremiobacteraeota bacterium]|nr:hypothetical protein [Candidatus Eremiobacteraeota bacterium]
MLLSDMTAELGDVVYRHERAHRGEGWQAAEATPEHCFTVVAWDCNGSFDAIKHALELAEVSPTPEGDRVATILTRYFAVACCTAQNTSGTSDAWKYANRCFRHRVQS